MKYRLGVFLIIIFFMAGISQATDKKTTSSSQVKAVKPAIDKPEPSTMKKNSKSGSSKTDKIQAFLEKVSNARTLDEIKRAFEKANFTSSELKLLDQESEKGRYKEKIERLAKKSELKPPPQALKSKGKKQDIKQLRSKLRQDQQRELQQANQAANATLSTIRNSSERARPTVPRSAPRFAPALSPSEMNPQGSVASSVSPVEIRSELGAIIGQSLNIWGRGFGHSTGRVLFYIGEGNSRIGPLSADIQSWQDTQINVTIPLSWEQYVPFFGRWSSTRSGDKWGRVYVENADVGMGGWERVQFFLDRSRYMPEIEPLHDSIVRPGQILLITGNQFKIGDEKPIVELNFGSTWIDLTTQEYDDDYVQVMLDPDFGGLPEMQGTVRVKTPIGETNPMTITFKPSLEVVEIISEEIKEICSLASALSSFKYFLCFIGESSSHTLHNWTLQNSWVVEDTWLETEERGINAGAYYLHKPSQGSIQAASRIEVWADAYSRAITKEHLILKGPKGTSYRN